MSATISSLTGNDVHQYLHRYFFPSAQEDFAARLKWSVTPKYPDANHAPVAQIEGPQNMANIAGRNDQANR